ncbi:uncharacterized protein LOC126627109 [Malus sylvestris]|uniref:uncharacterized protein LOC126627109 n=1 Tax=Malus sylvestris TaxID=3752 RepID=UPI0021ACFF03|nr:uncharacterized protein LOC126627109 [Malus sylvestris]
MPVEIGVPLNCFPEARAVEHVRVLEQDIDDRQGYEDRFGKIPLIGMEGKRPTSYAPAPMTVVTVVQHRSDVCYTGKCCCFIMTGILARKNKVISNRSDQRVKNNPK